MAQLPELRFGRGVEPPPKPARPKNAPDRGPLLHDFNNAIAIVLLNAQLVLDQLLPDHPLRTELVELCAAAERASALARQLVPGGEAAAPLPAQLPSQDRPTLGAAGPGGTVLVVEDDELVRDVVERVLTSRGFRVLTAADGAEAEALARGEPLIDLVLTDVNLPDLTGDEVARRICAAHEEARVLFMSGSEAKGLGGWFLRKPFTPQLLLQQVRLALEAAP